MGLSTPTVFIFQLKAEEIHLGFTCFLKVELHINTRDRKCCWVHAVYLGSETQMKALYLTSHAIEMLNITSKRENNLNRFFIAFKLDLDTSTYIIFSNSGTFFFADLSL